MASHWWANPSNPRFAHADQHILVFHPQYNGTTNKIMFVGNDGGIFRTNDARAVTATGPTAPCSEFNGNVTWTELNNNYGVTQFYHGVPYPSGTTYFGGTQDNGTIRGTDSNGADGWSTILGGDGGYVAVDPANTNILYAENTRLSIQKSTNGGSSFSPATKGITESGSNFLFIAPFVMDPSNSQRLWTGGFFLWRTTNGAASWVQASAITAGAGSVSVIAVAPTNPNTVLAGMSDGFIHRTNIGLASTSATNWPSVQPRSGFVSSLTFDPTSANIAYVTYSTFGGTHVWKSTDAGATWVGIDGSGNARIPDIPVHSLVVDPVNTSRLYVGTDLGVFVSRDGGTTWAIENTGFANVITEALSVGNVGGVPHIFAFTHGRGVWRVPTAEAIAALGVFRPSQGRWFFDTNQDGVTNSAVTYGTTGDIPVPADYNGDEINDLAVFRPSQRRWFIDTDRNGTTNLSVPYGIDGDIPVPADYDGDGITDLAVWRPTQGRWFIDTNRNGTTDLAVTYGTRGDIPVPADYDGDGMTDLAVFRPAQGRWFLDTNRNGATDRTITYGVSTDIPVPADYDGDLMVDVAVFRPAQGRWFLDTNRNGATDKAVPYGISCDIPLRANGWILTALKILIFTDWLSSSGYQKEFDRQLTNGCYPVAVEGRNQEGQSQFRGAFVPFPSGPFSFFSHHGLTHEVYDQRNAELTNEGYAQVWLQTFTDASDIERFQATWVKQ